jgi:soluble lytic murein transglycosylase-like protein
MQINSIHLPRLLKQGITEERLLNEPCLSVEVGASILAEFIQRFGYNWTAVGSYNVAGPGPSARRCVGATRKNLDALRGPGHAAPLTFGRALAHPSPRL